MEDVYDAYPKLYHYTNFDGLKGILKSNTLWATHYKALNDFREVEQFRPRLKNLVEKYILTAFRKGAKANPDYRRFLRRNGGIASCARQEAERVVSIFYDITYNNFNPSGVPFADPYFFSFCAHTDSEPYVQQNGLLIPTVIN